MAEIWVGHLECYSEQINKELNVSCETMVYSELPCGVKTCTQKFDNWSSNVTEWVKKEQITFQQYFPRDPT